jgi:transmembrane sensor
MTHEKSMPTPTCPTHITETALGWLHADRSDPAVFAAHQEWMNASPEHAREFRELDSIRTRLKTLSRSDWDAIDARHAPPVRTRPHHVGLLRHAIPAAIAAAVYLMAVLALVMPKLPTDDDRLDNGAEWTTFTATSSDSKPVALADGSQMILNTESVVRVRFSSAVREVQLVRGEALFTVTRESDRPTTARPFDVKVSTISVRATGTAFVVRVRDTSNVDVVVSEGRVVISDLTGNRRSVEAGTLMRVRNDQFEPQQLTASELARQLAWSVPRLNFAGETLTDAVAKFNAYNKHKLIVCDASVASVRVGGVFAANNVDGFLLSLRTQLEVTTRPVESGDTICIYGRNTEGNDRQ